MRNQYIFFFPVFLGKKDFRFYCMWSYVCLMFLHISSNLAKLCFKKLPPFIPHHFFFLFQVSARLLNPSAYILLLRDFARYFWISCHTHELANSSLVTLYLCSKKISTSDSLCHELASVWCSNVHIFRDWNFTRNFAFAICHCQSKQVQGERITYWRLLSFYQNSG